jgi:hypothetical protein
MSRSLQRSDGALRRFCENRLNLGIDFSGLDYSAVPEGLVGQARRVWQERVETEFRSVQIMSRFLTDVLAAGETLDVYALANDFVQDEIKHVALCSGVVEALGARALLPEPAEIEETREFLRLGAAERALSIAVAMLGVNETLSVGYIRDLRDRCDHSVMRSILDLILADEETHQGLGWDFIANSLDRFPIASLPAWKRVAADALEPQRVQSERILAAMPVEQQRLAAFPEPNLAALGLMSAQRQALVFKNTVDGILAPRLRKLSLLDSTAEAGRV